MQPASPPPPSDAAPPPEPPDAASAEANSPPPAATQVVGVGASAGGLEAFSALLRSLPPNPGLALLLVQHLDPARPSLLPEILGRESPLPVVEAAEGMRIEADRVYVLPPDARMGVVGGVVRLEPRGDRSAVHMPVDHLFRSLAAEYGDRAIGVVLSGGGMDGTLGLAAIKEAGGAAFAQDLDSAGQRGMPESAVDGGCVDLVLPPERIAAELVRAAANPGLFREAPLEASDVDFAPLFAQLRVRTGVDFTHYKQSTVRRRVARRMALRGMTEVGELVKAVREDPAEAAALHRDLLIGVTRFFRDPEGYDALRTTAFPALIRDRAPGAAIRIWVVGCSTGEEAYSVAMQLLEALEEVSCDAQVKILATDLNEQSLNVARAGAYSEHAVDGVSPERLRRFFRKTDGRWRVNQAVRELCVFARHDAACDPAFARMDLVTCRNVLIYFDAELQKRVVPLFHYALRPNGYLLLGPSETVGAFSDLFVPHGDHRLYTRTLAPVRMPAILSGGFGFAHRPLLESPAALPSFDGNAPHDLQREADRVLARYAPPGVLIDDQGTILQFRGDTAPFLRHSPGTATLDVLRMAAEGLFAELREAIDAARSGNVSVRRTAVLVGSDDVPFPVVVSVNPLRSAPSRLRSYLVLFEDPRTAAQPFPTPPPWAGGPTADGNPPELVAQLRRELEASREHLQAAAEEHEAAAEELKSSNEEILASNEELQSANEELQTAKEEMQSGNEELETVNEELQHRNRELGRLNDDLVNLLAGVHIPVVMVGRDLVVRRMTAEAQAVFNLIPADVGRSIREIRSNLDLLDLDRHIAQVIDTLEPASFEAQDRSGRWHSVRIRPYETHDNRIDGAVVAVIEIDALKQAEKARRELEAKMFQAQKLESLGILAGGVAHDLNNLLTPILGYASLARDALPADGVPAQHLVELEKHVRRAADLVLQILAYSGKGRFQVGPVDLSGLVQEMSGLLRVVAKRADLRFDLAADVPPIEADATQIGQVVMNLVMNAVEALGESGTATVRTRAVHADRAELSSSYLPDFEPPSGIYALLEVADTGSGMSPETLAKLFDPFYTTKFTGRGLGLAAVLGIVRGHGGVIRVQSALGNGSVFRVYLPILKRSAAAKPVSADERPVPSAPLPASAAAIPVPAAPMIQADAAGPAPRLPETLLVVDDDAAVRTLAGVALRSEGWTVYEAGGGEEALRLFRERIDEIDLILVDATMPGMDGAATAAAARGLKPSVRIILTSGWTDAADSGGLAAAQAAVFVPKPFGMSELAAAVRAAFQQPPPQG